MRFHLCILDTDQSYASRLTDYLAAHYASEVVLSRFSALEDLQAFIEKKHRVDVVLASPDVLPDASVLPAKVEVLYIMKEDGASSYAGKEACCKYQDVNKIFRLVMNLAADALNNSKTEFGISGDGRVITIFGSAGGVGTSTVAAALASRLARQGKTVLYMPVQQNACPQDVFAKTCSSMTEVRYEVCSALKNNMNSGRVQMKMKSSMQQDPNTGVYAFDAYRLPVDCSNAAPDEAKILIQAARGICDVCILDIDNNLNSLMKKYLEESDDVVIVTDGSQRANSAAGKFLESLDVLENADELNLEARVYLIYNAFGSHGAKLTRVPAYVKETATFANYRGAESMQILQELVGRSFGPLEES
jgi:MinD-like ATPase involved in chromosome partitioning or flagellar assembly